MKKALLLLFLIPLIALAISLGCAKEEKEEEKAEASPTPAAEEAPKAPEEKRTPVAIVGNKKLYEEDIGQRDIDEAVEEELLYQVALQRGIDKRVEPQVDSYRRSLILDRTRLELLSEIDLDITEKDIENYFKKHQGQYTTLEIAEIVFPSEADARDFANRVQESDNIQLAIEQFTEKKPGISKEKYTMVVPIFTSALEVGSVSPITQVEGGYALETVLDKRPATLDEAYEMIFQNVHAIKTEEAYNQLIEKLKKEKNVVINKPLESPPPPAEEEPLPTPMPPKASPEATSSQTL